MQHPPQPSTGHVAAIPRSYLATLLLTICFGPIGLRHFYIGDKKFGWLRLGIFIGGHILTLIMALSDQLVLTLIGVLVIIGAYLWSAIDFFYVYFVLKADATGKPLYRTSRDNRWAKGIFIATISVVLIVTASAVTLGSLMEHAIRSQLRRQQQLQQQSQQLYQRLQR